MSGRASPRTCSVAGNLSDQGKYAEAGLLFQKALDIYRKVRGEDHPDTAITYNNLAANLSDQGKYGEAGPLFRKALDICCKVWGDDHPQTALSYNNVAFNLDAQGKYLEAEPLYEKALDIWRKSRGEYHRETALCYNNKAFNLNSQGKHAEAALAERVSDCQDAISVCRQSCPLRVPRGLILRLTPKNRTTGTTENRAPTSLGQPRPTPDNRGHLTLWPWWRRGGFLLFFVEENR